MLTIAQPWGLLALTAIPVVVGLYFFRQRFQPRPVAGLFLWPSAAEEPPAGRKRSRMEAPLSLFLEVLAALALATLLAGVGWETSRSVPHVIVVLDHSASMAASSDRAVGTIEQLCQENPSTLLTVILSGPRPQVIVGPAARASEQAALKKWKPILPHHAFGPAMTLATRLADAGGDIVVVTDDPDGAAAELGAGVRIRAVGAAQGNVGITMAERTLDAAGSRVSVRIANFGTQPESRTVTLGVATERIELAPGSDVALAWSVPEGHPIVRVALAESDTLEWDNAAILLEPKPRAVRVRCTLEDRERIEKACKAVAPVSWLGEADPEEPHLGIVSEAGEVSGEVWQLVIGAPVELRAGPPLEPLLGPYVPDAAHPLMEQLDFRGVIWSGAHRLKGDAPVMPLLTAGDVPLLFEWRKGRVPIYVMNIDPKRSNVHKSPAWPLFFHNLMRMRRDALPGLRRWNFRAGETVSFRPARPSDKVTLKGPDGAEILSVPARGHVEFLDTWQPGIYEILESDRFAVNLLDPHESDLRSTRDVAPVGGSEPAALLRVKMRWRWFEWLLCAAILMLVLGDLAVVAHVV
ncbi:MAG: BatA domain-containing protein [Planctomycetes bacterium]|nr:BatA domain-containing protein [Planctomycetota bacterium]